MYEYDYIFMIIHNYSADLTDAQGNQGASTAAQEALVSCPDPTLSRGETVW